MIWKVGDRAVLCYRPLPLPCLWSQDCLMHVGMIGTIKGPSEPDQLRSEYIRISIQYDNGDVRSPLVCCLAPIIEDPYAAIPKGEAVHA